MKKFLIVLFLAILIGCNPELESLDACNNYDFQSPFWIDDYYPANGSILTMNEFETAFTWYDEHYSVLIRFHNHYFDSCPIIGDGSFKNRVFLYIDGELIPNNEPSDELMMYYGPDKNGYNCYMADGPTVFKWAPELKKGQHHILVRIIGNTGNEYEFHWCFTIIEDN